MYRQLSGHCDSLVVYSFSEFSADHAWSDEWKRGSVRLDVAWGCSGSDAASIALEVAAHKHGSVNAPVSLNLQASAMQGSIRGAFDRSSFGISYLYESTGQSAW
jgi:hypothetical protein